MVTFSVDRMTLRLKDESNNRWNNDPAEKLAATIEEMLNLEEWFGERRQTYSRKNGNTINYIYGFEDPEDLMISFDLSHPYHGVTLRIAGGPLEEYLKKTDQTLSEFLEALGGLADDMMLIDINLSMLFDEEGIDMYQMREEWKAGNLGILCEVSKEKELLLVENCDIKVSGSRQSRFKPQLVFTMKFPIISNSLSVELTDETSQFEKRKNHFQKQIRVSLLVQGTYTAKMLSSLVEIDYDDAFARYIVSAFLDKVRFVRLKDGLICEDHDITRVLERCIDEETYSVHPAFNEIRSLAKSVQDLVDNSELHSLLYKANLIWGPEGTDAMVEKLVAKLTRRCPTKNAQKWVKRNSVIYKEKFPTAQSYFEKWLPY